MAHRKNASAVGLAKRRWDKLTAEERSAQNQRSAAARFAGMSKEERAQAMRALVARRWAKRPKDKRKATAG